MADLDYYGADYGDEEDSSRLMQAAWNFGLVNWAGAITSLGLAAGLAVWAVDTAFRDVSAVPVVRALEGPMRVAPEKPGGTVAPYQGLALSDITSGGAAAPAPDQIVLAPPPVTLDAPAQAERAAARAAAETTTAAGTVAEAATLAEPEKAAAITSDAETLAAAAPEAAAPLAAALSRLAQTSSDGAAPQPEIAAPEQAAPDAAPIIAQAPVTDADASATDEAVLAEASVEVLPENVPGLARSDRPRRRPDAPRRVAATAPAPADTAPPRVVTDLHLASADPAAATAPRREVDPAAVAPGTRVVQLGAFDSEAIARGEWTRLEAKFRDYMAGKSLMIQKARSGGRDFWRLRIVGFADGSESRRFCSALLAQNAACIPVTMR